MSVKKTKISMKLFIQNEDIICMRKNGKVSYHAQFAGVAVGNNYKMIKKWAEYSDETEEYVISASLGYSLYNSLVDLQIDISTLEDTISGLQTQIDELDTNIGGGGSVGNSSTYMLRLGNIIIQANKDGTVLTIKNATPTTQVALKVSGNVIGYV